MCSELSGTATPALSALAVPSGNGLGGKAVALAQPCAVTSYSGGWPVRRHPTPGHLASALPHARWTSSPASRPGPPMGPPPSGWGCARRRSRGICARPCGNLVRTLGWRRWSPRGGPGCCRRFRPTPALAAPWPFLRHSAAVSHPTAPYDHFAVLATSRSATPPCVPHSSGGALKYVMPTLLLFPSPPRDSEIQRVVA